MSSNRIPIAMFRNLKKIIKQRKNYKMLIRNPSVDQGSIKDRIAYYDDEISLRLYALNVLKGWHGKLYIRKMEEKYVNI